MRDPAVVCVAVFLFIIMLAVMTAASDISALLKETNKEEPKEEARMEKADFQNYRLLAQEVRTLQARLKELEGAIYAPAGQQYARQPGSSSGRTKTLDDAVAAHAALEERLLRMLSEKNRQLLVIYQAVEALEEPAERLVMEYRYIDGHSWRKVCYLMQRHGYSERQVYRLHGRALEKLKEA